jgi:hypothetical protein
LELTLTEKLIQIADVLVIEPDIGYFQQVNRGYTTVVRTDLPFKDTQAARDAAYAHPDFDRAEASRLAQHPSRAAVMPVIERTREGDVMIAGWTTWEMLRGKVTIIPVLLVTR